MLAFVYKVIWLNNGNQDYINAAHTSKCPAAR